MSLQDHLPTNRGLPPSAFVRNYVLAKPRRWFCSMVPVCICVDLSTSGENRRWGWAVASTTVAVDPGIDPRTQPHLESRFMSELAEKSRRRWWQIIYNFGPAAIFSSAHCTCIHTVMMKDNSGKLYSTSKIVRTRQLLRR